MTNASVNRSKPAYRSNKDTKKHAHDIDELVTVLRFVNHKDKESDMLSWFAVHTNNLPNTWKYLSSDNKGYASMKFEALKQSNDDEQAFAQSTPEDMSPNLDQPSPTEFTKNASGLGKTPEENLAIIGDRQYRAAEPARRCRPSKIPASPARSSRVMPTPTQAT